MYSLLKKMPVLRPDRKRTVQGWAIILAAGLVGMCFVVWPGAGTGVMPADMMDGRLSAYMLEHFHRWITGREPEGFWNAPFFYPFPRVTAFSENFLGAGPVYSLFRWVGLDQKDAFRWWYLTGFAANYAACAYVLVKFRLRPTAVATGAFIFTFNMAAAWFSWHVHLLYRCGIPLAVYFFYRALRERRLMDWVWCGFWLVWQFYAGIYVGTFLAMLMTAFGVSVAAVNVPRRLRAGEKVREIFIGPVAASWRDADAVRRLAAVAGLAGLTAAMGALLYPFAHTAALYGFQRPWWVTYEMLPRVWSYLYSYNSRLWPRDWGIFDGLSFKNEHAMFTGASVWVLFAVSAAGIIRRGWAVEWRRPLLLPLLVAELCLVAVTLVAFRLTLYRLLYALPGLSAIRAVTRIIVALLFPVAVVCAFGVDALLERARMGKGRTPATIKLGLAVVVAGMVLEAVLVRHYSTTVETWQSRLNGMQAAISAMHLSPDLPRSPDDGPVIFVPPRAGERIELTEMDGLMLAQQNGFATLNGYSSNLPPGVNLNVYADGGASRIVAYFNFIGDADQARARALAGRVLVWNGSGFERMQWTGLPGPPAKREK